MTSDSNAQVAYDAKNLSFLSHSATQAVVNTDWYSGTHHAGNNAGMHPGTSWFKVEFISSLRVQFTMCSYIDCPEHSLHIPMGSAF